MYNTAAGMTKSRPSQFCQLPRAWQLWQLVWQHSDSLPLMPELAIDGDFCHWLITSPSMSACDDHLPIVIVWDGAGIPVRFMDNIVNIACLKCALDKPVKNMFHVSPCLVFEWKTLLHWAIILHKLRCLLAVVSSNEEHSWGSVPGHMPKSLLPEFVWCPGPGPSCPHVTSIQGVKEVIIISTSTCQPSHLHSVKKFRNLNDF